MLLRPLLMTLISISYRMYLCHTVASRVILVSDYQVSNPISFIEDYFWFSKSSFPATILGQALPAGLSKRNLVQWSQIVLHQRIEEFSDAMNPASAFLRRSHELGPRFSASRTHSFVPRWHKQ